MNFTTISIIIILSIFPVLSTADAYRAERNALIDEFNKEQDRLLQLLKNPKLDKKQKQEIRKQLRKQLDQLDINRQKIKEKYPSRMFPDVPNSTWNNMRAKINRDGTLDLSSLITTVNLSKKSKKNQKKYITNTLLPHINKYIDNICKKHSDNKDCARKAKTEWKNTISNLSSELDEKYQTKPVTRKKTPTPKPSPETQKPKPATNQRLPYFRPTKKLQQKQPRKKPATRKKTPTPKLSPETQKPTPSKRLLYFKPTKKLQQKQPRKKDSPDKAPSLLFQDVPLSHWSNIKATVKGDGTLDLSSIIATFSLAKKSKQNQKKYIINTLFPHLNQYIDSVCKKQSDNKDCARKAKTEWKDSMNNLSAELDQQNQNEFVHLERSKKLLQCGCEDKEQGSFSVLLAGASESVFNDFYDTLKSKDNTCQHKALANTLSQLQNVTTGGVLPKKCLNSKNHTDPECANMSKKVATMKARTEQMIELVYGKQAKSQTSAEFCLSCLLTKTHYSNPNDESQNKINQLVQSLNKVSQCAKLSPGQEKLMHRNWASYTIKMTQNGEYTVPLNLNFQADADYDGPVPTNQVPRFYRDKVQKCLKKASSKMLGPNGEKLNIVIQKPKTPPPDVCQNVKSETGTTIKIGSSNIRANSGVYRSNANCASITHEIMHQMGLCDEYKEKTIGIGVDPKTAMKIKYENINNAQKQGAVGIQTAYNCRVTSTNSLLADSQERWNNVFKHKTNKSLLNPEQFTAIQYGTCPSKNKKYNMCSALAYQTSPPDKCMEQKQKCTAEQGHQGRKDHHRISNPSKQL